MYCKLQAVKVLFCIVLGNVIGYKKIDWIKNRNGASGAAFIFIEQTFAYSDAASIL
jgi:hypothetical protein